MGRRAKWMAAVAVLTLVSVAPAFPHAKDPRTYEVAGALVAAGAVTVTASNGLRVGQLVYYVQTAGMARRADDGGDRTPASASDPWIAAAYYSLGTENDIKTFKSLSPASVSIDPQAGEGSVTFTMSGVGTVKLTMRSPIAGAPATNMFAFATPDDHHKHEFVMLGAMVAGRQPLVTGTIKKSGVTNKIVPMYYFDQRAAWVGHAAALIVQSA